MTESSSPGENDAAVFLNRIQGERCSLAVVHRDNLTMRITTGMAEAGLSFL